MNDMTLGYDGSEIREGDRVERRENLMEWMGSREGTVAAVLGNKIRVTLDSGVKQSQLGFATYFRKIGA